MICPSCGSSFNLLSDETVTRIAREQRTLGHFELLDRIGIGAFGEVWTAHDTELDRTVAIKLPRKGQLTAEEAESFLREARSAARLNHPGIVAVHEVGRADDQLFIAFAPASNLLASASADTTNKIWNLTTGRELRVLSQHDAPVRAVAFSPDECTIATACDDRKVRTWNIASQEPPKVFTDHAAAVLSLAFSPDGHSLVSTSWDNTLRVWDSYDVDRKPKVLTGHSLWVSSVLFTSDGRTLFSASGDRTVKSWDVAPWQQTFTFNGHTKGVQCLAVSPDGNIVASGSRDGTIRLWRAATTQ